LLPAAEAFVPVADLEALLPHVHAAINGKIL
jgi:hypothetical protein